MKQYITVTFLLAVLVCQAVSLSTVVQATSSTTIESSSANTPQSILLELSSVSMSASITPSASQDQSNNATSPVSTNNTISPSPAASSTIQMSSYIPSTTASVSASESSSALVSGSESGQSSASISASELSSVSMSASITPSASQDQSNNATSSVSTNNTISPSPAASSTIQMSSYIPAFSDWTKDCEKQCCGEYKEGAWKSNADTKMVNMTRTCSATSCLPDNTYGTNLIVNVTCKVGCDDVCSSAAYIKMSSIALLVVFVSIFKNMIDV